MGGSQYQDCDRNSDPATGQRSPRPPCGRCPLEVRMPSAGLRSVIAAAIRTTRPPCWRCPAVPRAGVGDHGVLRLCDAPGGLPDVRRDRRASPLVRRQASIDDNVPLVPGGRGQASLLEGCGRGVWHDVAERVSLCKTCGFVGVGPPQSGRRRVDRRRRSAVAKGAQVFDAGPCSDRKRADRRWLAAAVMDRQGPHDQDLPAVLPHAGQRTFRQTDVRVQRPVEAVLEGDRQKGRRRHSCAGPVSHHAEDAICR